MADGNRQFLAKVWQPLFRGFSRTIERACLRRDAYLDHVFAHEAKALKQEIPCRNSPAARTYLQNELEKLDRVSVNFSLSPTTIDSVNRVCEELNVVRDCFINRVLFLLVADMNTGEAITSIELRRDLPDFLAGHDRDFIYAPLWGGSLRAVSEIVRSDPPILGAAATSSTTVREAGGRIRRTASRLPDHARECSRNRPPEQTSSR